jgi:hypothetical protein
MKRIRVYLTSEELAVVKQWRAAKRCAAKMAFDSQTAAMREAIRRMARHENRAPALRVYECEVCGKFHLTSKPNWKQRKDG